jgi:hypothetical protein
LQDKQKFSRQDSLRGSLNSKRSWWNVVHYNLHVTPDISQKTIKGWNQISFDVISGGPKKVMKIDLQQPMLIDSIIFNNKKIKPFKRDGNAVLIEFTAAAPTALDGHPVTLYSMKVYFHGKPRENQSSLDGADMKQMKKVAPGSQLF